MATLQSLLENWPSFVDKVGIVGGLVFTGLALRRDIRIRKAEMVLKVTSQHREVWRELRSARAMLFDPARDMLVKPLTDDESFDLASILNHFRSTYYLERAGIYVQPYGLSADIDLFFSYPAAALFWEENKRYYEPKFVEYAERRRRS